MQPNTILAVGKVRDRNILGLIDDIGKRFKVRMIEVKDVRDRNPEVVKRREYELLKSHITGDKYNILLCESGRIYTTEGFCEKIGKISKPVQFIVTGAFGPSKDLVEAVDEVLSLSPMTFTHEMTRYVLLEQLYRVYCDEKNIPYNK